MAATTTPIQVSGLAKRKLATLHAQAKTMGMSAEGYARHLIEEGISLERLARTKTFDGLYAPAQARFHASGMSEQDLDQMVHRVRSRRRSTSRKEV